MHDNAAYLLDQADLTAAQQNFEQALALNKQRKVTQSAAETQIALSEVFLEQNEPARSAELARESAAEMRRLKDPRLELEAQIVLARAALACEPIARTPLYIPDLRDTRISM